MPAIIASAGVRRSGSCILREVTSAAPQLGSEDQKRSRRRGGGNRAAASDDCLVLWNKAALFAAPTPKLVAAGLRSFPIRPGLESGPAPAGSPRFRVAASGLLRAEAACRPSGVNFILRRSSQAEL